MHALLSSIQDAEDGKGAEEITSVALPAVRYWKVRTVARVACCTTSTMYVEPWKREGRCFEEQ